MDSYPKWKYHATKEAVVVDSEEEEKALGKGWKDTPAAFEKAEKDTEAGE
jgi:hypothetical protein